MCVMTPWPAAILSIVLGPLSVRGRSASRNGTNRFGVSPTICQACKFKVPLMWQYWDSVTDNPLNLFLFSLCVPLAVYLLWPPEASSPASMPSTKEARSLAPSAQYSTLPPEHSKSIEWVKYTPLTLALHDGTHASQDGNTDKILLAINGQVFDVSSGRNFYGPNGPYGNFAGRDASRGMAKQSFALGTCR